MATAANQVWLVGLSTKCGALSCESETIVAGVGTPTPVFPPDTGVGVPTPATIPGWAIFHHFLFAIESHFNLSHVLSRLLSPIGIALAVGDYDLSRQPGAQTRPAVVFLDPDADLHALDDFGEFPRYDIARHQGKLCAGGLVDPDDAATKRRIESVESKFHLVAGRNPA